MCSQRKTAGIRSLFSHTLTAVALVMFCLPVLGQVREAGKFEEPTRLEPLNVTLHDLLAQQHPIAAQSSPRKPSVAWGDTEPIFIFPLVGSTPGGGGTFFHTESVIANELSRPQDVLLFWFPAGGGSANCSRPSVRFHMNGNTWYYWVDMASQLLNASGLGAVVVVAADSAGNLDTTALLDGFSKIWTYIPGSSGTVAQSFVAESLNTDQGLQFAYGLRQDAGFRTNVGIFNYDVVPRNFTVKVYGSNGAGTGSGTATVDACNVTLFPAPAGSWNRMLVSITADDGRGLWYGFASTVDNVSGASWSSVAHPY